MHALKWNTSNNICSSKTIFPSFYTSQASTEHPLCFKSFIMASYQSVVNINIIMKFLIGHKVFVSLCTLSHWVLLTLTNKSRRQHARLSRSGPGVDPRSGQVSWVRFLRGFSSPVRL